MVMPRGTIIQRKSATTEGAAASFPRTRVCCVAMAPEPPEKGLPADDRQAVRWEEVVVLFNVAGLGHFAGRRVLSLGKRRVGRLLAGKGRREDLAYGCGQALELG